MYLLLDDKNKLPFPFVLISVVMHALIFIIVVNYVSKLKALPSLKREIIEIEIAALNPSAQLVAQLKQLAGDKEGGLIVKPEANKVSKSVKPLAISAVDEHKSFVPNEDFSKLEFKGQAWSSEVEQESAPELVDESVDNLDNSGDDYQAFHKDYANEELDSDLKQAQNKNAELAIAQGQKLTADLDRDSQELTQHTESLIQKEKLARAQAAAYAQAQVEKGKSSQKHLESGNANSFNQNGSSTSSGNSNYGGNGLAGGSHQAVRALREFKQMPGNKKPEYELADRRANKQGQVVYHAFIDSSGAPEKFTLIKSSGYPSLDENTLSALKKWRFYPGQEGWVELPFKWSLKGGAVEAPSSLRIR